MTSRKRQPDIPVLIVGGGPVGLAMALLLERQGVSSVIVERRAARTSSAPKAHVVNPRSLEILRALDLDLEAMRATSPPRSDQESSRFMTTLSGVELGRIDLDVPEAEALRTTPTPLLNLAQPKFEAMLRAAAQKSAGIEFRAEHCWIAGRSDDGGTTSTILAANATYEIQSRFLVAADGASSAVREALGIGMDGNPSVRPRVTIHFEADLRPIVRDRPAILYWILDPAVAGTFIAYDIERTWVYTPRVMPEAFDRAAYSDSRCATMILGAIGRHDVDLEIKHVVPWMMAAQVATTYRRHSCFLIGDAAHSFPPTGGLGLNTGLQDAHNLAWKIALALRGAGAPDVLDSYEAERRPIAEINTRQSLHNSSRLPDLFRLAEESIVGKQVREGDRARLAAEIATHREHFCSPGLQLGFSYGPPVHGPADTTRYDPTAARGDRMPHAWVEHRGRRISTLDLLDPASFTLFVSPGGTAWRDEVAPFEVTTIELNESYAFESDWPNLCGLSGRGAMLLVRPDGHIAEVVPDDGAKSRSAIVSALRRWLSPKIS